MPSRVNACVLCGSTNVIEAFPEGTLTIIACRACFALVRITFSDARDDHLTGHIELHGASHEQPTS